MMSLGDFEAGDEVYLMWSSNNASGASVTRATNGTISVYKDAGTTQSTAGVTDVEDFDSLTGVHHVTIDTSADGTFYADGNEFFVVLSGATIDGATVNAVLGHFSIGRLQNVTVRSHTTAAKAEINAEIVDALATDTYAEPGQGTPAATLSLSGKIGYLFKAWRNKKTQTSSQYSLFADDASTVDQKASVSDDATTTTIGEIATGP